MFSVTDHQKNVNYNHSEVHLPPVRLPSVHPPTQTRAGKQAEKREPAGAVAGRLVQPLRKQCGGFSGNYKGNCLRTQGFHFWVFI